MIGGLQWPESRLTHAHDPNPGEVICKQVIAACAATNDASAPQGERSVPIWSRQPERCIARDLADGLTAQREHLRAKWGLTVKHEQSAVDSSNTGGVSKLPRLPATPTKSAHYLPRRPAEDVDFGDCVCAACKGIHCKELIAIRRDASKPTMTVSAR